MHTHSQYTERVELVSWTFVLCKVVAKQHEVATQHIYAMLEVETELKTEWNKPGKIRHTEIHIGKRVHIVHFKTPKIFAARYVCMEFKICICKIAHTSLFRVCSRRRWVSKRASKQCIYVLIWAIRYSQWFSIVWAHFFLLSLISIADIVNECLFYPTKSSPPPPGCSLMLPPSLPPPPLPKN